MYRFFWFSRSKPIDWTLLINKTDKRGIWLERKFYDWITLKHFMILKSQNIYCLPGPLWSILAKRCLFTVLWSEVCCLRDNLSQINKSFNWFFERKTLTRSLGNLRMRLSRRSSCRKQFLYTTITTDKRRYYATGSLCSQSKVCRILYRGIPLPRTLNVKCF